MYDTRNDLPVDTRTRVIALLNARLADAIDLGAQSKHAHWNVKGPNFIALHELFDKVAETVEEQIDTIAERVTALGGRAHGTLAMAARATTLRPYPEDIAEGLAHVDALSAALADHGAKLRAAIESADRLGDADTADLFTGLSRETDKYLWFLEAHLHAKR
jgi:starvation-inducible DNA-binding protein